MECMIDAQSVLDALARDSYCQRMQQALEEDYQQDPAAATEEYRRLQREYLSHADAGEVWRYVKPDMAAVVRELSDTWDVLTQVKRKLIFQGMRIDLWLDEHPVAVPASRPRGRVQQHLFQLQSGEKDVELAQRCADQMAKFLELHPVPEGCSRYLESSNANYLTNVFMAFYEHWRDQGFTHPQLNGQACRRFLMEDCHLPCGTAEKSYGDWLKLRIEKGEIDIVRKCDVRGFLKSQR